MADKNSETYNFWRIRPSELSLMSLLILANKTIHADGKKLSDYEEYKKTALLIFIIMMFLLDVRSS